MKHFGYFLLSTMIVLSGWGYQSLLFCHHSNFCLMENMRISQRLIALSNVCLFKWDQNINHARQVIKAWWSQIYVGNVQQNFVKLSFEFSTTHPMTVTMKTYIWELYYLQPCIEISHCTKKPLLLLVEIFHGRKLLGLVFNYATKIGINIFCHTTKIGIKKSTKNWNKKSHQILESKFSVMPLKLE